MKKILLFISLIFISFSYSQTIPMLEEGNAWSVDIYGWEAPLITKQITISGSTIIDGKEYKSVIINEIEYCLLREEGDYIYKYNTSTDEEFIYYDFSLEVGDEFIVDPLIYHVECVGPGTYLYNPTVIDTSIQFIAGENRKVIEFAVGGAFVVETWIEGIGSLSGVDSFGENFDNLLKLVCFTKDGITTFFNGADSCDNTDLSVDDFSKNSVVLYPNPVTSTSILQFSIEGINSITIFDVTGKHIKTANITKDYFLIDAMQFASGLYFYHVYSDTNLIKSDKFIVK